MADSFASLVADCLETIEREAPAAAAQLATILAGRAVEITIDRETFTVDAAGTLRVGPPSGSAPVTLRAASGTVDDVIDGRISLADAVLSDRLLAIGEVDDLRIAHDALIQFVHGGVRSPSVPAMRTRFRQLAEATP